MVGSARIKGSKKGKGINVEKKEEKEMLSPSIEPLSRGAICYTVKNCSFFCLCVCELNGVGEMQGVSGGKKGKDKSGRGDIRRLLSLWRDRGGEKREGGYESGDRDVREENEVSATVAARDPLGKKFLMTPRRKGVIEEERRRKEGGAVSWRTPREGRAL